MMPLQARHRLLLLLSTATLCACGSVEPQGALKAVMGGNMFESAPRNPAEEKLREDDRRQRDRHVPPPMEKKGQMGFKIAL